MSIAPPTEPLVDFDKTTAFAKKHAQDMVSSEVTGYKNLAEEAGFGNVWKMLAQWIKTTFPSLSFLLPENDTPATATAAANPAISPTISPNPAAANAAAQAAAAGTNAGQGTTVTSADTPPSTPVGTPNKPQRTIK